MPLVAGNVPGYHREGMWPQGHATGVPVEGEITPGHLGQRTAVQQVFHLHHLSRRIEPWLECHQATDGLAIGGGKHGNCDGALCSREGCFGLALHP